MRGINRYLMAANWWSIVAMHGLGGGTHTLEIEATETVGAADGCDGTDSRPRESFSISAPNWCRAVIADGVGSFKLWGVFKFWIKRNRKYLAALAAKHVYGGALVYLFAHDSACLLVVCSVRKNCVCVCVMCGVTACAGVWNALAHMLRLHVGVYVYLYGLCALTCVCGCVSGWERLQMLRVRVRKLVCTLLAAHIYLDSGSQSSCASKLDSSVSVEVAEWAWLGVDGKLFFRILRHVQRRSIRERGQVYVHIRQLIGKCLWAPANACTHTGNNQHVGGGSVNHALDNAYIAYPMTAPGTASCCQTDRPYAAADFRPSSDAVWPACAPSDST